MSYSVEILQIGYTQLKDASSIYANGTVSLILGRKKIIVDTGSPWDKAHILSKLSQLDVKPEDIDYVICTHSHFDHIGNNNLFPEATFLIDNTIIKKEHYQVYDYSLNPFTIDKGVYVITTPGHTDNDLSVIVKTNSGTIVIAGDLFESKEDLLQPKLWQSMSKNPLIQEESRKKVLAIADFIIPGHGNIFSCPVKVRI